MVAADEGRVVGQKMKRASADASGPNSPWGASWGPREPPRTGTLERPDAERQPGASASRSLHGEIATVRRAPNCDWKGLRGRRDLMRAQEVRSAIVQTVSSRSVTVSPGSAALRGEEARTAIL